MSEAPKLTLEQRQRAQALVDSPAFDEPDDVAFELIWLRDEVARLARVAAGAGEPTLPRMPNETLRELLHEGMQTVEDSAGHVTAQDLAAWVEARGVVIQRGAGDRPPELNEAAIDAAEKAYWADDGVSRHNMAAAIRAYLVALGDRPPAPSEAMIDAALAAAQRCRGDEESDRECVARMLWAALGAASPAAAPPKEGK